ncbi:MAG: amidohydrolase family protein [Armatimonadota bacterium]|nr:amidohydrolase family protein [Armatimonadota bacterium]
MQRILCKYLIADPDRLRDGVISDAALIIDGGRVLAAGPAWQLQQEFGHLPTFGDPEGWLALPGLVNAHHHGRGLSTVALGIDDAPLEFWLPALLGARHPDIYANTAYAAALMLRAGVTTSIHSHAGGGTAQAYRASVEDALRAYHNVGVRVALAMGIADQQLLAYHPDASLMEEAPKPVRAHVARWFDLARPYIDTGDYFGLFDAIREQCGEGRPYPRATVMLNPRGPQWATDDLLEQVGSRARLTGAGVHLHLLETPLQRMAAFRRWQTSAVEALDRLGVLGPRTSVAHAIWLDEADIDRLAATGTTVVTNTSSNLRLGSGLAPLHVFQKRGVHVAIGTDSAGLFADEDMWKEMRLLAAVHRISAQQSQWLSPYDLLRMATVVGARAALLDGQVGRLLPGYRADITILNLKRVRTPYMDPQIDEVGLALSLAQASDVDTVMVDGNELVRGGAFTRLDLAALASALARSARASEPVRREIAEILPALRAYLATVYGAWT